MNLGFETSNSQKKAFYFKLDDHIEDKFNQTDDKDN